MDDKLRVMFWTCPSRPTTAPMRGFSMQVDWPLKERGRLKRTWMEVMRIDLKKCNLYENSPQDTLEW